MGKRFQKHFKGIRCWKKTSADSNVEDDGKDQNVTVEKVQKRSRRLSKEEDLLQRIAELELYLTKTISDMYARLELQEKMNNEVLDKYLVKPVEGGGDVKGEHQKDDDYQKIREAVSCQIQQELRRLLEKDKKAVEVVKDSRNYVANRPILEANNTVVSDESRSVMSTYTGPDKPFNSEEVSKDVVTKDTRVANTNLLSIGSQTELLSTTSDIADLGESRQAINPEVVDKDVPVSNQQATPMKSFSHRPRSIFDNLLDKAIAEVVRDQETDTYANKGSTTWIVTPRAKFSSNEVWNLTPLEEYYKRVSPPDPPVPLYEGESPFNSPFKRRRGKSRLSRLNITIPTMLSTTNTQQSTKRKLGRLETTKPAIWSNEVVEPDIDIKMPIKPNECDKKADPAPTEVECFGKPVPDCCKLTYAPLEVPVKEKDEADVIRDDIRSKLLYELKQKLIRIEAVRRQAIEPVIVEVYKEVHCTSIMEVEKLRKLCRQMFFEETTHYARGAAPGFGRLTLSNFGLQYMNAAYQQSKAGLNEYSEGYRVVRPLREMCRQLFGIKNTARQESNNKQTNYESANIDVRKEQDKKVDIDVSFQQEADKPKTDQVAKHPVPVGIELIGQFGSVTGRLKCPEPKWEEWTDHTVTDLVQFTHQLPDINHAPTLLRFTVTLDLRDLMERYGNSGLFQERHIQFLGVNILKALKYVHAQGIVHTSITPRKVIFNSFGYPTLMPNVELLGPKIQPRIEYSSPEEITSGPITMATDIFQTGMLMYSVLYGRSPYKAATYKETKANLLNESFTPEFESGTLSKDGRYFVRKCLRNDPDARFKLVKCKKSLEKAVKWFKMIKEGELVNQDYPSPFMDLMVQNT